VITAAAFVLAAAVGSLGRAEAGRRWNRHDGVAYGTLLVNVSGAFALGLVSDMAAPIVTVIGVGGLGAYTTFSSFARDVVALVQGRRILAAVSYVVTTCVAGIGAAAAGVALS
jgi:CrcB protein